LGKTKKLAPLEGVEAHHGGDVCVCVCGPTLKNYGAGVFRSRLNLNSYKAVHETNKKSPRENTIKQKNCQQAINAVKSIKRRGKTAMETGASPGAVVSLKVDC
jgi:hypothetical protein